MRLAFTHPALSTSDIGDLKAAPNFLHTIILVIVTRRIRGHSFQLPSSLTN